MAVGIVALAMCASSLSAETVTVRAGVPTWLARHWIYTAACEQKNIDIRVTQLPSNGTLSWRAEPLTIPAADDSGNPQPCAGRVMYVVVLYYQPKPGFHGQDELRYWRVNLDSPDDPNNRERVLTISVAE